MRTLTGLLIALSLALAWAVPAFAEDLPPGLAELLRAANPKERDTIKNVAKRAYPEQRQAIDDLVDDIKDEEEARTGKSKFVEGWTGEGSLGANVSAGNTDEWNVSAGLDIKRKGPVWEHRFQVDIDLGDVEGERTEERISAAYRARRDFENSHWFMFGSLRYERDPFQGTRNRFTESVGGGYQLIDTDKMDWDIYAGPAFRQTDFTDGSYKGEPGLFAATDFKWEVSDTLTLRNYTGAVLTADNESYRTTTSLTNNLYGELSARLEFTVDHETNPPFGAENTDSYSRVSLVYGFGPQ